MKLWRVARRKYSASGREAFAGTGGLYVAGRWHSQGRLIVYAARTESLARLEALVHLNPALAPQMVLIEAELPDALVTPFAGTPPAGWADVPDSGAARAIGDAWLRAGSSVAIEVPSIHSKSETNLLVNPSHPDFRQLVIRAPSGISFDHRLNDPLIR